MWNKWGLLFVGLTFSATTLARESKPVEDRDAFEKQYIECAMNNFKGDCLVPLIRDHANPEAATNVEQASEALSKMIKKSIEGSSVYKVYPFNKKIKAEIFDDRMYLVMKKDGELLFMRITFRMKFDNWYVHSVNFTVDKDEIAKSVDVPF